MKNPWGLTPEEARAMDAIIQTGCQKRAAALLGRSQRTIEDRIKRARDKLGTRGQIHHLLLWDRWKREVSKW